MRACARPSPAARVKTGTNADESAASRDEGPDQVRHLERDRERVESRPAAPEVVRGHHLADEAEDRERAGGEREDRRRPRAAASARHRVLVHAARCEEGRLQARQRLASAFGTPSSRPARLRALSSRCRTSSQQKKRVRLGRQAAAREPALTAHDREDAGERLCKLRSPPGTRTRSRPSTALSYAGSIARGARGASATGTPPRAGPGRAARLYAEGSRQRPREAGDVDQRTLELESRRRAGSHSLTARSSPAEPHDRLRAARSRS